MKLGWFFSLKKYAQFVNKKLQVSLNFSYYAGSKNKNQFQQKVPRLIIFYVENYHREIISIKLWLYWIWFWVLKTSSLNCHPPCREYLAIFQNVDHPDLQIGRFFLALFFTIAKKAPNLRAKYSIKYMIVWYEFQLAKNIKS